MKQVFNKKGEIVVEEVPSPTISDDEVLVQVYYSCISSGTEISVLKNQGKSLVKKVLDKPQNVQKVLEMIKEKGLLDSIAKVKRKIDIRNPIGYSASGIVLKGGKKIKEIKLGDGVACAGSGIANHAEFIAVPENLLVKIPENLSIKEASTVALGAIALQGVRRCSPEIGSYVVVIGLGILGQITSQILKVSGCRVLGIDIDEKRINKAISFGLYKGINAKSSNVVHEIIQNTNGFGADAVIITAASESDSLINQSVEMCRRKGKVVIVGDVAINIKREEFYKRELDILISTSYGPGRYDDNYEVKGFEYPYAYIRWTEKRNMDEYLKLASEKKLDIDDLIEGTFPIESAKEAYEYIKSDSKPLIVLLEYNRELKPKNKISFEYKVGAKKGKINVGIVGAGSFTQDVHLPNLEKLKDIFSIYAICSKVGGEAESIARRYRACIATTDYKQILNDENIELVLISTRHNLHAKIAVDALRAGKAVFVEKPMALNDNELLELKEIIEETKIPYMVGFNRRFSPYSLLIKKLISARNGPLIINYRMNAGYIPKEHWVHNEEGGGRNIGEACHIYDLFNFLTDSEFYSISAHSITPLSEQYLINDNFSTIIKYKNGSVCNLIYTSMGSGIAPKEQMDVYFDGQNLYLSDFKELYLYDARIKLLDKGIQNKGHLNELKSFGEYLRGNSETQAIPLWQLIQATEISFEVEKQIKEN
ncbi:MAG: bi-domain-containing oxidoreductase [Actinobacteria bacterium]|nr:bi-domain-containing oxidoreductase [Actinomycetota bacterium]